MNKVTSGFHLDSLPIARRKEKPNQMHMCQRLKNKNMVDNDLDLIKEKNLTDVYSSGWRNIPKCQTHCS